MKAESSSIAPSAPKAVNATLQARMPAKSETPYSTLSHPMVRSWSILTVYACCLAGFASTCSILVPASSLSLRESSANAARVVSSGLQRFGIRLPVAGRTAPEVVTPNGPHR